MDSPRKKIAAFLLFTLLMTLLEKSLTAPLWWMCCSCALLAEWCGFLGEAAAGVGGDGQEGCREPPLAVRLRPATQQLLWQGSYRIWQWKGCLCVFNGLEPFISIIAKNISHSVRKLKSIIFVLMCIFMNNKIPLWLTLSSQCSTKLWGWQCCPVFTSCKNREEQLLFWLE